MRVGDMGSWVHRKLVVVVLSGAAAACGDPSGGARATRDTGVGGVGGSAEQGGAGGGGAEQGGAGGGTAAATGSGGSSGTGGSGSALLGGGLIAAEQRTAPVGFNLKAEFESWAAGPRCTRRMVDTCELSTCARDNDLPPPLSAGTVGVSSGNVERTISPSTFADYPIIAEAIQLWEDGAGVRLFAEGGDFPAVDEMFVGPAPLTVLEPSSSSTIVIDRTQPFEARWSGGTGGTVVVAVAGANANEQFLTAKCSFPPSAGAGSVPASVLAEFNPDWVAGVYVYPEDHRIVRAGPWEVRLTVRRDMILRDVTLQ